MNIINLENMCSQLRKKLEQPDGIYHIVWKALQVDPELSAKVQSRQLHIFRNQKKILILAGKAQPKMLADDSLCFLLNTTSTSYTSSETWTKPNSKTTGL